MLRVIIGRPTYRAQVHVGAVAEMFALLHSGDLAGDMKIAGFIPVDSCTIEHARNLMTYVAITREPAADWLLGIDADTYSIDGAAVTRMILAGEDRRAAVIAAPVCLSRGRGWNVQDLLGRDFAVLEGNVVAEEDIDDVERSQREAQRTTADISAITGRVAEVGKVGAAYVAVNLNWLRQHWPQQPWYWSEQLAGPAPRKNGEDYIFCSEVRKRGGHIFVDGRVATTHEHP